MSDRRPHRTCASLSLHPLSSLLLGQTPWSVVFAACVPRTESPPSSETRWFFSWWELCSRCSRPDSARTSSFSQGLTASRGSSVLAWPAWGLRHYLMNEIHFQRSSPEAVISLIVWPSWIVSGLLEIISPAGRWTFTRCRSYTNCLWVLHVATGSVYEHNFA